MNVRRERVHETEVFQGKLSGAPSRQGWGGGWLVGGREGETESQAPLTGGGVVPPREDMEVPGVTCSRNLERS